MSDPLDLFPGVAPPLLATLSAPAVLRAGACCRRWRDVTRRVAGRRTAEGAGPAAVALLVRTEECEGRSEVACALAALTRNLQWAPEVALIFATEDAACYSDGNGVRTLEADARARLPRACLVACGRAPGVFGPVAGALQEVVDAGGCAVLLLRGARGAGPPGLLAVPGRRRRADKAARGVVSGQAPRPAPPFPPDASSAAAARAAAAAAPLLLDAVRREEVATRRPVSPLRRGPERRVDAIGASARNRRDRRRPPRRRASSGPTRARPRSRRRGCARAAPRRGTWCWSSMATRRSATRSAPAATCVEIIQ